MAEARSAAMLGVRRGAVRQHHRALAGRNEGSAMENVYSATGIQQARRETLVGKVMGLLAFSLLFTAGGALLGRQLGPGAILISIVGSIGTLVILFFTRTRPGLNLALFYAFSVFEGMAVGVIVES